MKQAHETEAAYAARCATASRIASSAPESTTGWVVEPDGVTIRAADDLDAEEVVHTSRRQLEETVAWCLYVQAFQALEAAPAAPERMNSGSETSAEYAAAVAERADRWVPACGGQEVEFVHKGRRWLYVFNPATGAHGYLDLDADLVTPEGPWEAAG